MMYDTVSVLAHGHFVYYSVSSVSRRVRVTWTNERPPKLELHIAVSAVSNGLFFWSQWPKLHSIRTIAVYNIRRTCRCDWRSQKLGVHWASQSSSFWPIKIRNTSASPRRSANGTRTGSLKRIHCPVLWTTWSNGTVKMTFRKKWTSRKVRSSNHSRLVSSYCCYILFICLIVSYAPDHLDYMISSY